MGHKARIMYLERKAGNLTGPARIGRVTHSKTGATIYYRGKEFRSLKGAGFKANYYDVESGEEYWISGREKTAVMPSIPPTFLLKSTTMSGTNTGLVSESGQKTTQGRFTWTASVLSAQRF